MLPYRDSRFARIVLILFFIAATLYALFEARGFLSGPVVHVPDDIITVDQAFTSIRGRADRISELRLNGKVISVTENGEFDEPYLLAQGSNRLVFEARDGRGRTTQKILTVVYSPRPNELSPVFSTSTTSSTSNEISANEL